MTELSIAQYRSTFDVLLFYHYIHLHLQANMSLIQNKVFKRITYKKKSTFRMESTFKNQQLCVKKKSENSLVFFEVEFLIHKSIVYGVTSAYLNYFCLRHKCVIQPLYLSFSTYGMQRFNICQFTCHYGNKVYYTFVRYL